MLTHSHLNYIKLLTYILIYCKPYISNIPQASKRRMRRSSVDDGTALAAAAAAAAAPEAAAAQATTCALEPTAASLVGGYLSHSADLYSTYTRIYDRLTMFYQDNRAGEDVFLLPGAVLPWCWCCGLAGLEHNSSVGKLHCVRQQGWGRRVPTAR
jgi:hypothetical protein